MNAAILELERAAAEHWRAPSTERLGGWLLRAASGFTGRANSALPLGSPGLPLPAAVAAVSSWYRARELPPMIAVPGPLDGQMGPLDEYLAEQSWSVRSGAAVVMTASVADVPVPSSADVRIDPEPDAAWCALYRYRGQPLPPTARALLMSAPWQAFASIRSGDGAAIAVGRTSVAHGWGMITAVEVDPAFRRRGLGVTITAALCHEAARQGASRIQLQTVTGNAPARSLYARCGFRLAHRYHYRVAPPALSPDPRLPEASLRTLPTPRVTSKPSLRTLPTSRVPKYQGISGAKVS